MIQLEPVYLLAKFELALVIIEMMLMILAVIDQIAEVLTKTAKTRGLQAKNNTRRMVYKR